jgi:tetratricopeptide (TPR) repeat protein
MIGNYGNAIELNLKAYAIDTSNTSIINELVVYYMFSGQYDESLKYHKKYEQLKVLEKFAEDNLHHIGYVYYRNGYKEEAEYYFDRKAELCNIEIELGRPSKQNFEVYYDLAAIYAFRGEKDKAYENLRIFNQLEIVHFGMMNFIKIDPLFNSIRSESEFQQIVKEAESKFQAEHERVRQWLEENDR